MKQIFMFTLITAGTVGCFSASEKTEVTEVLQPQEVQKSARANETAKGKQAEMNSAIELKSPHRPSEEAPMTKALPTEILVSDAQQNSSAVHGSLSRPQIFIIRDGRLIISQQTKSKTEALPPNKTGAQPDAENRNYTVVASMLNVRSGPSMDFSVIEVVKKGHQFQALSVEGIWVQVRHNAYVSLNHLQETSEIYAERKSLD